MDQKDLAKQNAFLRCLCVVFAVALILTAIALPFLDKHQPNPEEAPHLNNYSETVTEQWSRTDLIPVAARADGKVVRYVF
ncbi:hypothetical protein D3C73_651840 [compost metagenome]